MLALSKRFLRPRTLTSFGKRSFFFRNVYAKPAMKGGYAKTFKRGLPLIGMGAASLFMTKYSLYGSTINPTTTDAEQNFDLHEITDHEQLQEGEMMAIKVGEKDDDKVLIARYQGKLYAMKNSCAHFGVPLAGSVMFDDKVICPAHNAAFSIIDGTPEHGPIMSGLPTFEVVEKDGKYFVKLPSDWKQNQTIYMAKRDPENKSKYVIIGGGPAGMAAAETLRQSDFTGEIIILSSEDRIAYDRTLLSKALTGLNANDCFLRKQDFLNEYGLDFRANSLVKQVDTGANEVVLSDGTKVSYDKLLIATGGYPKKPIVPGIDLQNVFTLRSAKDQEDIKAQVDKGKNVVVIGASFIGFECAASIVGKFKDEINVQVVDMAKTPFERSFGEDVGKVLQSLAEENGVKFILNNGLTKLIGEDGKVTGVELSDGTKIDADVVLLGTGIQPSTQFIQDGIDLHKDGSILVNPYLQTSTKNVYAAGDIATYPYWVTGDRIRVEHWNHATQQGECAAYNMLDKNIPYDEIPFFWTRNYMKSVQYAGYHREYDEIFIDGDCSEQKFVAYYIKDDKVLAAAGLNRGADIHIIKEAMKLGLMPKASQIKDGSVTPNDLKDAIKAKPGSSSCKKKQCCSKQPS